MGKFGIKCGNCKDYHGTVEDVKACFGIAAPSVSTAVDGALAFVPGVPATGKQMDFIRTLRAERGIPTSDPIPGGSTKKAASDYITHLKSLPRIDAGKTGASSFPPLPDVPAGHYAIASLTGNNDLDFFRVDRPDKGAHKGKTFIKRIVGGKPDVNVRFAEYRKILRAILDAGVDAAGQLYGREIGRCRFCNRHLTDEVSRAVGAGPDCREHHGIAA